MNTSIMRDVPVEDIATKTDEKTTAIVLNIDELAQVAGGRQVNEYEGQHR
ncbi:hypothetical protein [Microvirga brassicacearum]|nr:hypothetical protein [Microvirga brassicacearum]